jgi:hypothetical protein
MTLKTMKKIIRRSWDAIPMPSAVITRVNTRGHDQPEQFVFTDRAGRLIGDVPTPDNNDAVEIPGVDGEEEAVETPLQLAPDEPDDGTTSTPEIEASDLDNQQDEEELAPLQPAPTPEEPTGTNQELVIPATVPKIEAQETTAAPAQIPGVRRSTSVKIAKQDYVPSMSGSKYAFGAIWQIEKQGVIHPYTHTFFQTDLQQATPDVVAMIMTQLSLKAGLKQWGSRGRKAAHSEMKQLHFRDTFKPMHWRELTPEQKLTVLESHLFLKEKRDSSIKGRTVTGGNKQRDYITKKDSSSPTVATEAVLLTCIIDADEERDVAVIDIPNAFIQT